MATFQILLISAVFALAGAAIHGRFMEPVSRSSIWRLPEFRNRNPPVNYDDSQLNCGGILQEDDPGTNCGICGDPVAQATPRDNEWGGNYSVGITTGRYGAGATMDVEVKLEADSGSMEWRLCIRPEDESLECFNTRDVLRLADGSGTKLLVTGPGTYRTQVLLPPSIRHCSNCIIQWNYRAANVGDCGNGTRLPGCGPQATLRACSDIVIA